MTFTSLIPQIIPKWITLVVIYERLPRTEAHMLTVKPERLDGSGLSGNSSVLKLNLSSRPGSMFILGLLSLSSASSGKLAIIRLGRSGWYLNENEN